MGEVAADRFSDPGSIPGTSSALSGFRGNPKAVFRRNTGQNKGYGKYGKLFSKALDLNKSEPL